MKFKIGFNGITLFLVFLVLKLTGIIGWSWWWVTAPLWLPFIIIAVVVAGFLMLMTMAAMAIKNDPGGGW